MVLKKMLFAAAAAGIFLTVGCREVFRNEMDEQDIETIETKEDIENSFINCQFEPLPGDNSHFSVKLEKVEKVEMTKRQLNEKKITYTPYVWYHEIWEFPAGVGLLPVSICSHLLSACTFNVYPFRISSTINDLAFTGMNPFLNWECSMETAHREEQERKAGKLTEDDSWTLIESRQDTPKILEKKTLTRSVPVAKETVLLTSGNLAKQYTTDEFGSFKVYYIHPMQSLENFTPRKRKFTVKLTGENGKTAMRGNTVILRRDFMQKLSRASSRIASYRVQPTAKGLYNMVIELEKMGFTDLAYELEESELAKQNSAFVNEFNDISD